VRRRHQLEDVSATPVAARGNGLAQFGRISLRVVEAVTAFRTQRRDIVQRIV